MTVPLLDQVADLLGGWSYDQEAGREAWRRAGRPSESPRARGEARIFLRRAHALQTAMRAEAAGADAPGIVAGLLHDIGHVFAPPPPAGYESGYDDMHEVIGALWLRQCFVDAVCEPVRGHVAAKRYLVATRKDYGGRLASDSTRSLNRQGGPMNEAEIAEFRDQPHWEASVRLRVWDDAAKEWEAHLPPLERFVPALESAMQR